MAMMHWPKVLKKILTRPQDPEFFRLPVETGYTILVSTVTSFLTIFRLCTERLQQPVTHLPSENQLTSGSGLYQTSEANAVAARH